MSNSDSVWQIASSTAGQRLDAALAVFLPDLSLRARRRLWDTHKVLVNDKPRPAGWMLRENDTVRLHPRTGETSEGAAHVLPAIPQPSDGQSSGGQPSSVQPVAAQAASARLIARHGNLLFFYKPASLHTSSLEGRGGPSLEALLPALCAEHAPPRLVNRLDCGTSGIVVAALHEHDALQWRRMEDAGLCEKRYYALLCGHLTAPLTIRNTLDTAKRRITKILATESLDTLRHTRFRPLGYLPAEAMHSLRQSLTGLAPAPTALEGCTLALCTIAKGARHQIRAHALCAGFPLWGDTLYTRSPHSLPPATAEHNFLLHHGALAMPGVRVQCPSPWLPLLPEPVQQAIQILAV